VDKHRGTDETLEERIVEILGDSGSLSETLFKSKVQALSDLLHPAEIEQPPRHQQYENTQQLEPPRLPECRLDPKGDADF
jgi:hypothetical protein